MENSKIEIYKTSSNIEVQVSFNDDTFWLSQKQISELFQKDRSVITKHIKNVFREEELFEIGNVQKMHFSNSDKPTILYSLDVIISVGYRINSKQGTQFRQWATQRLKEYLVEGASVNKKRLEELGKTIQLIHNSIENNEFNLSETKGVLEILKHYTQSFVILNQFDSNRLKQKYLTENITYEITYQEAKEAIRTLKNKLILKKEATELFGNEKDNSFEGVLGSVVQTFGGEYV